MPPAPASLQDLIDETKTAFIAAKADGKLDVSEVVQIAVQLAGRLQAFHGASGAEKRAVVVLTLKKGLKAAGGVGSLPGLAKSSAEVKAVLEKQLLDAAGAAVDAALAVASGKMDLRKQGGSCLLACLKTAAAVALAPKDAAVVAEALSAAEPVVLRVGYAVTIEESKTESNPESVETKDDAAREPEPAAKEDSAPETQ